MRSLATKLILAFLVVSLVGVGLAAFLIQRRTQSEFDRFLFRQGTDTLASALVAYYVEHGSWEGCEQLLREHSAQQRMMMRRQGAGQQPGSQMPVLQRMTTLTAADGRIVCGQEGAAAFLPARALQRGLALEVDGEVVGYLLAGAGWGDRIPLSPEQVFLRQVNRLIGFSALAAVGLALALGLLLTRTLTRPLDELIVAAQQIARGKLGYQVPVRSQDELGRLATAFNTMSADLEKSTQMRKQMTADVAHDLRTPLSLILGYTEALSDGKLSGDAEIYSVMHREAQHLNRLIDDLRLLSLADSGELPLERVQIAPALVLQRAEASFRPQAVHRGVELEVQAADNLPQVSVDPERIAQVLGNLLTNALRHTPAGGRITLSASASGENVLLQVRDTGRGIAPEDLPHIFDRFYRADKSRSPGGESGLGLSIARSLIEAHGGRISAANADAGPGAIFTILLPVLP